MSRISRYIRAAHERWSAQPLRLAAYLALIGCVVLSGPWACVAHCRMLDFMAAHSHGHHTHAAMSALTLGAECPAEMHGDTHQMAEPPSAITFGILITLVLLPLLRVALFQPALGTLLPVSVTHPPPRYPPRRSQSSF